MVKAGYSEVHAHLHLNGLYVRVGLRRISERTEYRTLYRVFPFAVVFIDLVTGTEESNEMTGAFDIL